MHGFSVNGYEREVTTGLSNSYRNSYMSQPEYSTNRSIFDYETPREEQNPNNRWLDDYGWL